MNSIYAELSAEELVLEAISYVVGGISIPSELTELIGSEVARNLELVGESVNDYTHDIPQ